MDNLKPDIFTFSVTVGPDYQGLALLSLSFQSFLKFPVGKAVRAQPTEQLIYTSTLNRSDGNINNVLRISQLGEKETRENHPYRF